jgi:hypothetical protein
LENETPTGASILFFKTPLENIQSEKTPLVLVSQLTLKEPAVFTKNNQQFVKGYLTSS